MAQPAPMTSMPYSTSPQKSFIVTWLLSLFLGGLGVDRFYLGKVGTGILKLITFGGFGIWYLIDLIIILAGAARDKGGRPLEGYAKSKLVAWIVTALFVILGGITGANGIGNAASAPNFDTTPEQATPSSISAPASAEKNEPAPSEKTPVSEPSEEPVEEQDSEAVQWANETWGAFSEVKKSGTGDSVLKLPADVTGGLITATHSGSSNFVISVLDENNESTGELLVNTIGKYSGTTPWGLNAMAEGVRLEVKADGPWKITINQMGDAKKLASSGKGNEVFLYEGDSGILAATHKGQGNFVILEETADAFNMGLLVNEIGKYSGSVALQNGPSLISVTADGAWTLAVE